MVAPCLPMLFALSTISVQNAGAGGVLEILEHSALDTLPMLPVLLLLYFVLEYLWHHRGVDVLRVVRLSGGLGPVVGTLLGILPQCGMSVFMTTLYLGGRISMGTLVATYLSTSDEALPILVAHGGQSGPILFIIAAKAVLGIVSGYAIDLATGGRVYKGSVRARQARIAHTVETELRFTPLIRVLRHAVRRTAEIYAWVFVATVLLSIGMSQMHAASLFAVFAAHPFLEIFAVGAFGLIPNCAASVAIAEAFMHAGISLGATVTGLAAGSGYGPIVLLKDGNIKTASLILVLGYALSVIAGFLILFFFS